MLKTTHVALRCFGMALAALAFACSTQSDNPSCMPGTQVSCRCDTGKQGFAVCDDGERGFGACQCEPGTDRDGGGSIAQDAAAPPESDSSVGGAPPDAGGFPSTGGAAGGASGAGGSSGLSGAGGSGGSDAVLCGLTPLDVHILLDQSSSMNDPAGASSSKWQGVTTAITNVVQSALWAGVGVGIQYFALPDACNSADYAVPSVAIAPLPMNFVPVRDSMSLHAPSTNRPMAPALQGAVDYATSWATSHPTHTVVTVLITDGEPNECSPTDIASVAQIAANACNASPKTQTHVIGIGTSTVSLDPIAQSGCTNQAFVVDTGADVAQQTLSALNTVRQAYTCEYFISGATASTEVNVEYRPGDMSSSLVVPKLSDSSACDPSGGWHYDDNTSPSRIVFCPTTCDTFRADSTGDLRVLCR